MSFSQKELDHIWKKTLENIKEKITNPSFNTWFSETKAVMTTAENQMVLQVPNNFIQEWIESQYTDLIEEILEDLTGNQWTLLLLTPKEVKKFKENKEKNNDTAEEETQEVEIVEENIEEDSIESELKQNGFNPKYTFDTFVVGNSNRFAHAASLAVAEAPAKAYNPLFIYGDVGLGKTHLMQAIAHFILKNNPDYKVVYVSSETFTNELINSIKDDSTVDFRDKYRNIDILLVDDIQFLAGKERTQEEFFHTFNTLHESNRQLIISSDRPPKEIPTLEERLRSRAEIQRVFRSGRSVRTNGMRLAYLPNDRPQNRIVVVPARGFRTAVERNLCRRHGKEAYRALKADCSVGFDLAIVCFPGEYSFAERRDQLSSLFTKAHLRTARSSKEM